MWVGGSTPQCKAKVPGSGRNTTMTVANRLQMGEQIARFLAQNEVPEYGRWPIVAQQCFNLRPSRAVVARLQRAHKTYIEQQNAGAITPFAAGARTRQTRRLVAEDPYLAPNSCPRSPSTRRQTAPMPFAPVVVDRPLSHPTRARSPCLPPHISRPAPRHCVLCQAISIPSSSAICMSPLIHIEHVSELGSRCGWGLRSARGGAFG